LHLELLALQKLYIATWLSILKTDKKTNLRKVEDLICFCSKKSKQINYSMPSIKQVELDVDGNKPVVKRFICPPEIPLRISSPTMVSAQPSSPSICINSLRCYVNLDHNCNFLTNVAYFPYVLMFITTRSFVLNWVYVTCPPTSHGDRISQRQTNKHVMCILDPTSWLGIRSAKGRFWKGCYSL